jgi:putative flippase GtrA
MQRGPSPTVPTAPGDQPETLIAAFHRTVAFPTARAGDAVLPLDVIQEHAREEAAFGRVAVDPRGLTAGMRLHALQAARGVLAGWREARAPFDRLLVPHMKDIEAVDRLDAEVADLQVRCEDEIGRREQALQTDVKYIQAERRYQRAEGRYEAKFAENNQRVATTWGYNPLYIVALGCIGIAEWLINYDTFFLFTQVPAIAAGATIILGVLLAFAAHGHGTLLRQWSHRFGAHRARADRLGDWRLLALSTFGLLVVLGAAGGSRYAAALRALASQPQFNILGAEAEIQLDPLRDVLLSLLANVAAWAVGVFIAYIAHDPDPEYMEATHERTRARRVYNRRRKRADREIEGIRARYGRQIAEKSNAAKSRWRDVEEQRNLLLQVREHERAIVAGLQGALYATLEGYRDALVRIGTQQKGALTFVRASDGAALTPYEYKNTPILIDAGFVQDLA